MKVVTCEDLAEILFVAVLRLLLDTNDLDPADPAPHVGNAERARSRYARYVATRTFTLEHSKSASSRTTTGSKSKRCSPNRLARTLVDLLPRMCMRTAQLEVRLENGRDLGVPDPDSKLLASVLMIGTPTLEVLIASEMSFARKLSAGLV